MGTVLVTGGAGFLGKYVARSLAEAGDKVVITYRRNFHPPGVLADIMDSHVKAVRCDVLDLPELTRVIRDQGVDSIVHAAHISNYEAPIYTCLQTNVLGTINVLEAAATASIKKFTYISSVAGGAASAESEDISIVSAPVSVVSPSKKVGEVLSLYYGATFGFPVVVVRPGMFYGPYGEAEIGSVKVLKSILERVISGQPADLPDTNREDRFALIYVRDVGESIALLHRASTNQHRAYALDAEKLTSWGEIAEIVKEFIPNAEITFGRGGQPGRGRVPPETYNITGEFGFKPKFSMREGLRELIEWYQKGKP